MKETKKSLPILRSFDIPECPVASLPADGYISSTALARPKTVIRRREKGVY
jgi:hypothetical protein